MHKYVGDAVNRVTRNETVTSHHFAGKCRKEGHIPALCPLNTGPTPPSQLQQQADKFSNLTNRCIHCGGEHIPNSCPVRYQPKATSGSSNYGSPKQNTGHNNVASGQVRGNQSRQVTPQVSPLAQQNTFAQPTHSNSFPPPPYFPIPFPPPPIPPSNASIAPSAPASDLSAAISLIANAVNQGKCKYDQHHRRVTEDHDAELSFQQSGEQTLGMNERNYSLGDTFAVALQCKLKAIASER